MDRKNILNKFNILSKSINNINSNTLLDEYYLNIGIVTLTLGKSGLFVILPENFNVNEHIAKYPPYSYGFTTSLSKFDNNKVYYLLGLLSSIPARNKDLIIDDGYIPINAEFLNGFITDYNSYLEYLRVTGVIEWKDDGGYFDKHSRRYRWTEQYINSKFTRVNMPKFDKLSERKKAITLEQFFKYEKKQSLKNYNYVSKRFSIFTNMECSCVQTKQWSRED